MKKSKFRFLIIILSILIIVAGILLAIKIINNSKTVDVENGGIISLGKEEVKQENIKVYSGKERPIAIMIDNVGEALPQASLNNAYAVYEIIVEGGMTRLMPVYKGTNLEKVGPVRSSRHYFIDYAMENDAIYVHYGWSPQAQSDISKYKINNINGIYDTCFWRVKDKISPHNAVTSTEKLYKTIENKKYRKTSDKKSVLNYTANEINLETEQTALNIKIPYSNSQVTSYTYDETTKKYNRISNGKLQKDWVTGEQIVTKNIIITYAENYELTDDENKGRQGIKNIGTLNGWYITNGKAIKITCEKASRESKTTYKDLQGNEIKVNDGNTYIQICPVDAAVIIE